MRCYSRALATTGWPQLSRGDHTPDSRTSTFIRDRSMAGALVLSPENALEIEPPRLEPPSFENRDRAPATRPPAPAAPAPPWAACGYGTCRDRRSLSLSRRAACRCVSVRATTCAINVARSDSAALIVTVCPDLMPAAVPRTGHFYFGPTGRIVRIASYAKNGGRCRVTAIRNLRTATEKMGSCCLRWTTAPSPWGPTPKRPGG